MSIADSALISRAIDSLSESQRFLAKSIERLAVAIEKSTTERTMNAFDPEPGTIVEYTGEPTESLLARALALGAKIPRPTDQRKDGKAHARGVRRRKVRSPV